MGIIDFNIEKNSDEKNCGLFPFREPADGARRRAGQAFPFFELRETEGRALYSAGKGAGFSGNLGGNAETFRPI